MRNKLYHINLFFWGVFFYLIIPLLVVSSRIWEEYPGMHVLYEYYKDKYVIGYLLIVFGLSAFYLIGSFTPLFLKKGLLKLKFSPLPNNMGLLTFSFPLFLYSQYVVFANRNNLFHGYMSEIDSPFVGTLTTTSMYCLFMYLLNRNGRFSHRANFVLTLLLIELSVILLGLGSRMYVLAIFISLLVYFVESNSISKTKLFILVVVVALLAMAVGIWRIGGNINLEQMVYICIAEPTFTWVSAISMIDLNILPLVSFPDNFLSSFVNMLPFSPPYSEGLRKLVTGYPYSSLGISTCSVNSPS